MDLVCGKDGDDALTSAFPKVLFHFFFNFLNYSF
jgi:hypothetical protein